MLHRLTNETRLSSYVGMLDRWRMVVVEQVESPDFIRPEIDLGTEHPAYSTAMGKMLLAHLPEEQLQVFLARELPKRTPHTIVSKLKLCEELQSIRRAGFAVSEQEEFVGVRALAAPIADASGNVKAAVAVAGPVGLPVWRELKDLVALVQVAGHDISRNMRIRSRPSATSIL